MPVWPPAVLAEAVAAFDAYTGAVAYQAFADEWRVLAAGAPADLVQLSADPRTANPRTLRLITVEGTWLAGRRTYRPGKQ